MSNSLRVEELSLWDVGIMNQAGAKNQRKVLILECSTLTVIHGSLEHWGQWTKRL
jgi:hypothetical protein